VPIYEYRCLECGLTVEVLQKLHDKPLKRCEACSGKLEKIVSRTAFQLKGGGWYSSGYNKNPKASSPSSPEASGGADSKDKKASGDAPSGSKPGGCGPGCGCH